MKDKYTKIELENIPLRVVPSELDADDPKYMRVIQIKDDTVRNEI